MFKLTMLYDNTAAVKGVETDHGFAALIETLSTKILFDTGADGKLLLRNSKKLKINLGEIESIFLSHSDSDHAGGLSEVMKVIDVPVFAPESFRSFAPAGIDIRYITEPLMIAPKVFSTGELQGFTNKGNPKLSKNEHSLAVDTGDGIAVVVGCGHAGVDRVLTAAAYFGKPRALIGGFHGFNKLDCLAHLKMIAATHCTVHVKRIEKLYPESFCAGGVGRVIEL